MTRQRYLKYVLWPVLDDDGKLEYWDVHHPEDERGECHPVGEGFGTLAEAKAWIKARHDEDVMIRALESVERWKIKR